jgi:hypothetical protein
MTLAQAITSFLEHTRLIDSTVNTAGPNPEPSLLLLSEYFQTDTELSEILPTTVRDFLSRWYVEKAAAVLHNRSTSHAAGGLNQGASDQVPGPHDLMSSVEELFKWADRQTGESQTATLSPILLELRHSLPQALELTDALSNAIRELGGAFTFPEFLTSFEAGGSSQYDIDVPGNVGAIDGYFRIIRVEGSAVEAEEMISEQRVWPIMFPGKVATLLNPGFIISLELVRDRQGWQIADCGFAYPPGTEI